MKDNKHRFIQTLDEGFTVWSDPYNPRNRIVSITDLHQEGLDISLKNNPVCYNMKFKINGKFYKLPVVSIFKRTPYRINQYGDEKKDSDGNPVIYALKNQFNYRFDDKRDKALLLKRFELILEKIFKYTDDDDCTIILPEFKRVRNAETGIMMPSTNELNEIIKSAIEKVNPKINFIDRFLIKLDKYEVYDTFAITNSYFQQQLEKRGYSDNQIHLVLQTLERDIEEMPGDSFQKHFIKNSLFRHLISQTMEVHYPVDNYKANITGKHILLCDDTITYGQTLEEALNIIYNSYNPKSITILTMFSKKFQE